MATDYNAITLVGNLTRDPELRFTPNGAAVVNFGMASSRSWKAKNSDEWEEETSFFDVTAWGDQAENVAESLSKGNRVIVPGRLQQRSWEDKDDPEVKHYKVECVADEIGASLRYATVEITKVVKDKDAKKGKSKPKKEEYSEEPF